MGSDQVDKILDNALASYSQEEPLPGLDARTLNRIRAEGNAPRFAWLGSGMTRWAVVIPTFACLLVLALTFWSKRVSTPRPPKPVPTIAKALPALPIAARVAQVSFARPKLKHLLSPKREQFPTPTPLTDEERALLAFIAHSPKQAEEIFADAKNRSPEPIQIAEIHIKPLQDGR